MWVVCTNIMLIFQVYLLAGNPVEGERVNGEYRLLRHLFQNYSKDVRPVADVGGTVEVSFYMTMLQLIDVDEKMQMIKTNVWMYQEWNDYRLSWNSSDYDDVTVIVVPVSYIWNPDTSLLNSADGDFQGYPMVHLSYMDVQVFPDGHIVKVTPGILRTPCLMDITYFPVDRQTCYFEFGLWKYFDRLVRLSPGADNLAPENYIQNVEWDITGSSAEAVPKVFIAMDEGYDSFTSIIITLNIERKPLYYIMNVILPCVVVSILSMVSFFLPSSSPEKLDLSITLLLTMYVFNLLVIDLLPATSSTVPYLTRYLLFNMAIIGLSVAFTMLVLKIYKTPMNHNPMPRVIKNLFLGKLANILFVTVKSKLSIPDLDNGLSRKKTDRGRTTLTKKQLKMNLTVSPIQYIGEHRHLRQNFNFLNNRFSISKNKRNSNSDRTVALLQLLVSHFIPDKNKSKLHQEWMDLAAVLDRVLQAVFVVTFIIGAGIILPKIL